MPGVFERYRALEPRFAYAKLAKVTPSLCFPVLPRNMLWPRSFQYAFLPRIGCKWPSLTPTRFSQNRSKLAFSQAVAAEFLGTFLFILAAAGENA